MTGPAQMLGALCLTFVLMAFLNDPTEALKWIEAHPGLAAWLQAIGAIAAILGAFRLGEQQLLATRKLEADKRHLDDRLKTEIAYELFVDALANIGKLGELKTRNSRAAAKALTRIGELETQFRSLPIFDSPGAGVAVGFVQAPRVLGDLRVAAAVCLEAWQRLRTNPDAQLPAEVAGDFGRAHLVAARVMNTGKSLCLEQIARLDQLMPVND